MNDHIIVGVHITQRASRAVEVQTILSKYAANIRTRLGLHEVSDEGASPHALIVLDTVGQEAEIEEMCDALRKLPGIQVQRMFFSHPD